MATGMLSMASLEVPCFIMSCQGFSFFLVNFLKFFYLIILILVTGNRFFFYKIYPDYGFHSLYSSQYLPTPFLSRSTLFGFH